MFRASIDTRKTQFNRIFSHLLDSLRFLLLKAIVALIVYYWQGN